MVVKGVWNIDGGIGFFDYWYFFVVVDQVGVGVDFCYCCYYFGGQFFVGKCDIVYGGFIVQYVFVQFVDVLVFNLVIGCFVDVILNQVCYVVFFIGNYWIVVDICYCYF